MIMHDITKSPVLYRNTK